MPRKRCSPRAGSARKETVNAPAEPRAPARRAAASSSERASSGAHPGRRGLGEHPAVALRESDPERDVDQPRRPHRPPAVDQARRLDPAREVGVGSSIPRRVPRFLGGERGILPGFAYPMARSSGGGAMAETMNRQPARRPAVSRRNFLRGALAAVAVAGFDVHLQSWATAAELASGRAKAGGRLPPFRRPAPHRPGQPESRRGRLRPCRPSPADGGAEAGLDRGRRPPARLHPAGTASRSPPAARGTAPGGRPRWRPGW